MFQLTGVILWFVVALVTICALLALPTMLLWNWLMPVLFGVPTVTWFQAMGVNFLTAILFKGNIK